MKNNNNLSNKIIMKIKEVFYKIYKNFSNHYHLKLNYTMFIIKNKHQMRLIQKVNFMEKVIHILKLLNKIQMI